MEEGFAVAKLVEKHALSTVVRRKCASACAVVFIAGRDRVLVPGAKLGFHRALSPAWDDALYTDAAYNDGAVDYLKSKGITESFARKAFSVPNSDIWYPSADELLAAGVIGGRPSQANDPRL